MKLKIVVDTNILFIAILNPDGRIGRIIINSKKQFQFYSCDFLKFELLKHYSKLSKFTKLSPLELDELQFLLMKNIVFINESLLPPKTISDTESILKNLDINDTPFVALAKHLTARLWTGDKKLLVGLGAKDFIETVTTMQLSDLLNKLGDEQ